MNFFDHQDAARKKTGRLVFLFILAVISIVVALYATAIVVLELLDQQSERPAPGVDILSPTAALAALALSTLIIGGGTLFKLAQLRGGGKVIAEHMGGTLLTHATADATGKRVLNVVEEMAIAAGTPVPPVYLMARERGINAFAAGYHLEDAVIGVTRGTAERLTRDQLQGVIAHEFSHIVSGDMRINLRLVGILHGILLIGMIGQIMMRSLYYSSLASPRSSNRNDGNQIMIVILAVGAALAIIGFVGTFFGNWIKSAISRQREYLADASAVQFTRNPDGIAGALQVIGGFKGGARIANPNAPEASHMFFGSAMGQNLMNAFATHPPLRERIRRIKPDWDGQYLKLEPTSQEVAQREHDRRRVRSALGVDSTPPASATPTRQPAAAPATHRNFIEAIAAAGTISAAGVSTARDTIGRIPARLRDAAHDPFACRAAILALLLDDDQQTREAQLATLTNADPVLARELRAIAGEAGKLPRELRLPLLEVAMQPLAALSPKQTDAFAKNLEAFIRADRKVDLFEWTLHRLVTRRLDAAQGRAHAPRVRYYAINQLESQLAALLSAVARAGSPDETAAGAAFRAGGATIPNVNPNFRPRAESGLRDLSQALDRLDETAPKVKRQVLAAVAATIAHDRTITPTEAELFRAIAESLGVPVPPIYASA